MVEKLNNKKTEYQAIRPVLGRFGNQLRWFLFFVAVMLVVVLE